MRSRRDQLGVNIQDEPPSGRGAASVEAGPLLSVDNLSVRFDTSRGWVRALENVSLSVEPGECLGVVGESGSGKSVLGRAVMGLLPKNANFGESSRVMFGGRDVRSLTRSGSGNFWGTHVSMVFQDPMTSLNPVRRIGAQITDTLKLHLGMEPRAAQVRAAELLHRVGIADAKRRLRQYPHELSGGMRQRVMIAIAIACSPKLLIADEPTTALDVTVQKQILELLRELQVGEQMALILVSHDLALVAEYADRVTVMYAGRVVESAPTAALRSGARHRYTEALLRSTPTLLMRPHQRLDAIPGRPPSPTAAIEGCPFAPRCRFADDTCRQFHPEYRQSREGSRYSCHHPAGALESTAGVLEGSK